MDASSPFVGMGSGSAGELLPPLGSELKGPVGLAVSPKVEVNIKARGDEALLTRDEQTDIFAGHRDSKMSIFDEMNVESRWDSTQT
ncbi:hypothetical protein GUJ93_ZPchr0013g37330 [Zizania palustris]|uniref:Uncharacterized protein n=1 Tax=Zizania palustris TaxID=103762 RepID=A0A8J5X2P7_ZIZPA|nr:hypothetical protein GUJ93_ZPchr0013g37330 [Zizania palustris]